MIKSADLGMKVVYTDGRMLL